MSSTDETLQEILVKLCWIEGYLRGMNARCSGLTENPELIQEVRKAFKNLGKHQHIGIDPKKGEK